MADYQELFEVDFGKDKDLALVRDSLQYLGTVASYPCLVPLPSYHGVPVRGPGNNGLCMRLIKTARYALIVVYDEILRRRRHSQYSIALAILPQRPLIY